MTSRLKTDPVVLLISFTFLIGIIIGVLLDSPIILTIGTCVIWLMGFVYSIKDIRNRFTMFSFSVGFLVFLLGGYVLRLISTGTFNYFTNSIDTVRHTCLSLLISIGSITISGIIFHDRNRLSITEDDVIADTEQIRESSKSVIQVIVVVLVFSFVCELMVEIATTSFLRATSYANSENIKLNLPEIITYPASWFYVSLFLYWSTFPDKKKTWISIGALVIIEFIILLSGERGEPISLMFAAVFYILLRNRAGYEDIVIKKKHIVLLIVLIPVAMMFLQVLSETRVNRIYDFRESNVFADFMESQGVSVKIIGNGYDIKKDIQDIGGNTYILGEIRNYFKTNVFTRLITGSSYAKNKIALAKSGDLYSYTYMYLWSPVSYSNGIGSGSTYIAEVYHDGGYVLLVIVNILLAYLISVIDKYSFKSTILSMAIRINIFRYMVLLPRGYTLAWLTNTFAIQNVLLFLGLYFLIHRKRS